MDREEKGGVWGGWGGAHSGTAKLFPDGVIKPDDVVFHDQFQGGNNDVGVGDVCCKWQVLQEHVNQPESVGGINVCIH